MSFPDKNPKTCFGQAKPGIHAIPAVALLHCGRGMDDGCRKYGLTNWRENEVSASVYYNAAFRHLASWWDGEQDAADSGVHHLGHVMACCAILLDAEAMGQLNDDRPAIPGPFARMVAEMTRPMDDDDDFGEALGEPIDWDKECDAPEWVQISPDWFEETVQAIWGAASIQDATEVLARAIAGNDGEPGLAGEQDVEGGWVSDLGITGAEQVALDQTFEHGASRLPPCAHAYAFDAGEDVVLRQEITYSELDALIAEFLNGETGAKHLATFDNFRRHIGNHQHALYNLNNRLRLAFYIDTRLAGVDAGVLEMDEALRMCGLTFGAA